MDKKEIEKYFAVLGLEHGASLKDVKEAHRFLVQTFHEDKYPADSAMRARAKEKMIELNSAYEELKKFFEVYPEGWHAFEEHLEEKEMDWQTWQDTQQNEADGAIAAWKEEESVRRTQAKAEEGKSRRQNIFNLVTVSAWLLVPILFYGHGTTLAMHSGTDGRNAEYHHEVLNYHATMGTATKQDGENLLRAVRQYNEDSDTNTRSTYTLYMYVAFLTYMMVFPRPKRYIANWLETGEWADLKAHESKTKSAEKTADEQAQGWNEATNARNSATEAGIDTNSKTATNPHSHPNEEPATPDLREKVAA